MLTFPKEYFQDEVRDGFFVSAMMKCTWAAEMKVLDALIELFRKHGLTYYADYGTLLGAVRHGGFVPWDDDLDIVMPRADYMKMIACFSEMPEPYQLLSIYNSDTFHHFHAVVTNNNYEEKLSWNEKRLEQFYGCPFIVGVDIFPLDELAEDGEQERLRKFLYELAYRLVNQCVKIEEKEKKGITVRAEERANFKNGLKQLKEYLPQLMHGKIHIAQDRPLRNALCRAADQIAMSCTEKNAKYLDYYANMAVMEEPEPREKEWYQASLLLPFETMQICVPAVYTAVLENRFGPKYMEPIRESSAHGYPFYSKQKQYFEFLGHM